MVESLQKVYKNIKENLFAYPPEPPRRGGLRRHLHPAVSTAAGSVDLVMRAIPKRANIPITTVPFAGSAEAALYQPIDYLGTKEWAAFLRREYKDYVRF